MRCDGEEKDDDVLDGCKLTLNLLKGEKKETPIVLLLNA